jgi:hypothetical protein
MQANVTAGDAQAALIAAESARAHVVDEIDMPQWYWWALAGGWIGLGVIADVGPPWLSVVATFVFSAAHATAFGRVAGGRKSDQLMVSAATAGRTGTLAVLGCLIALGVLTVAAAVLVSADGANHPATIASVPVAIVIVLGGPVLMRIVRLTVARRSSRR